MKDHATTLRMRVSWGCLDPCLSNVQGFIPSRRASGATMLCGHCLRTLLRTGCCRMCGSGMVWRPLHFQKSWSADISPRRGARMRRTTMATLSPRRCWASRSLRNTKEASTCSLGPMSPPGELFAWIQEISLCTLSTCNTVWRWLKAAAIA